MKMRRNLPTVADSLGCTASLALYAACLFTLCVCCGYEAHLPKEFRSILPDRLTARAFSKVSRLEGAGVFYSQTDRRQLARLIEGKP